MTIDSDGEIRFPFLRSAFNYDMDAASLESALICEEETRTQQQFKEECDINTLVERFGLMGTWPQDLRIPLASEFHDVFDYQSALNQLIEADEAFMAIPAPIRAQFQNDAGKWVEYMSDCDPSEEKLAKWKEWGYRRPETARQAPIEVKVIPDPIEPPKTP